MQLHSPCPKDIYRRHNLDNDTIQFSGGLGETSFLTNNASTPRSKTDASNSSTTPSRTSKLSNKAPRAVNMSKESNQEEDFFLLKNIKRVDCYNLGEEEWVPVLELDPDSSRLLGRLTKSQLQFKSEPKDVAHPNRSQDDKITQRLTWHTTDIKGFATSVDEDIGTHSHANTFRCLYVQFKKPGKTTIDTRSIYDQEPLTRVYQLLKASHTKKGRMWLRISFHVKLTLLEVSKIMSLGLSQMTEWEIPQTSGTKLDTAVKDIIRSGKQRQRIKCTPERPTSIPVNPAVYRDDSIAVTFEYWSKADQSWVLPENHQTAELRLTMRFSELMLCVSAYREPLIMREFPRGNSQGLKNIKEARDRAISIATWIIHWSSSDIEGYIQNKSSSQMSYHFLLKKSGQLSAIGDDTTVLGTNRWRFDNNTMKLECIHDLIKDEFSSSIEKIPTVWIRLSTTKSVNKSLPFFSEVIKLKNISGREKAMLAFHRKSDRTTNRVGNDEEAVINTAAPAQTWFENDMNGHVLGFKESSSVESGKKHVNNKKEEKNSPSGSKPSMPAKDTLRDRFSEKSDIDPLALFKDEPIAESSNPRDFASDFYQDLLAIDGPMRPEERQMLEDYQLASAIHQSELQDTYEEQGETMWRMNADDISDIWNGQSSEGSTMKQKMDEERRPSLDELSIDQHTTELGKDTNIHAKNSDSGDVRLAVEEDVMESEALIFEENRLKAWNVVGPEEESKAPFLGIDIRPADTAKKPTSRHHNKDSSPETSKTDTNRKSHDRSTRPNTSDGRDYMSKGSCTIHRPEAFVSTRSDDNSTSIRADQDMMETSQESIDKKPSQLVSSSINSATTLSTNSGRANNTPGTTEKEDELTNSTQPPIAEFSSANANDSEETSLLYDICSTSVVSDPEAAVLESNISLMSRELQSFFDTRLFEENDPGNASNFDESLEQKRYNLASDEIDLLSFDEPPSPHTFPKIRSNQGEEPIIKTIDQEISSVSSPTTEPESRRCLFDDGCQEKSDSSSSRTVKMASAGKQRAVITPEECKMPPHVSVEKEEDTISVGFASGSQRTSRSTSTRPEAESTPATRARMSNTHSRENDSQEHLYGQNTSFQPYLPDPYFIPGMQMVINSSLDNTSSTNTQQRIYRLEIERQRHMQEAARCEQEIARCYEIQRRRHLEAAAAYHADIMRLNGGMSAQQQLMWTNMNSYLQSVPYPRFP